MEDICQFSVPTHEHGPVEIRASGEAINEKQFLLTLQVETRQDKALLEFMLDFGVPGRMEIAGLPGTSPLLNCIVSCAVGVLVTDIMECWKKHKTPKAMLQCLKAKGSSIASGVAGCIATCALSTP